MSAIATTIHQRVSARGPFDRNLTHFYQSDADFEKSISLWLRFLIPETTMSGGDLKLAQELLPAVPVSSLRTIKTKCNRRCSCGRKNNALDLISFCVSGSIHGTSFLTKIFNESRPNHKISIMDSVHRTPELPESVVYLDDTKPIPCYQCEEEVHLYLLHHSIAHYWH